MSEYFAIFIGASLVNNLILDSMLGVAPGLAVSRKTETALTMSAVMIYTLTLAALISYPLMHYLLIPARMEQLNLIALVMLISLITLLSERLLLLTRPDMHEWIVPFIPLTLVNCSVLGVALLNIQQVYGLMDSLFFGLGSGTGFGLVVIIMSALQERLAGAAVPRPFRGLPVLLITLGILSMAFMGFTGLVSN